jgi:hypothetical protein
MRYQLVLQLAADTLTDYDVLVALESQLTDVLGNGAVDGHDMGSGQANIFIHTAGPADTFRQLVPVLERGGHISRVTAAYRRMDGDRYHVLWPENLSRQFSVT